MNDRRAVLLRTLLVFVGGGGGASLRYLVGLAVPTTWAAPLPLAILVINLLGSGGLGSVFVLADEAHILGSRTRLVVAVGVLGGFTTWSTFMTGSVLLIQAGHPLVAGLYLVVALVGGPLAVVGGSTATRLVLTGRGRGLTHLPLSTEMATIEAEDREAGNRR